MWISLCLSLLLWPIPTPISLIRCASALSGSAGGDKVFAEPGIHVISWTFFVKSVVYFQGRAKEMPYQTVQISLGRVNAPGKQKPFQQLHCVVQTVIMSSQTSRCQGLLTAAAAYFWLSEKTDRCVERWAGHWKLHLDKIQNINTNRVDSDHPKEHLFVFGFTYWRTTANTCTNKSRKLKGLHVTICRNLHALITFLWDTCERIVYWCD